MKHIKLSFGVLTITAALAMQVHAQSWLTNGLVAYYPFNGNANDQSGMSNNLLVTGAQLAPDRFGNPNAAYHFNGVSDWMVSQSILPISNAMPRTVSAWFRNEDKTFYLGQPTITGFGHMNSTGDLFDVVLSSIGSVLLHSHYQVSESVSNVYADNLWYHVVIATEGSVDTLRAYLNGVEFTLTPHNSTNATYKTTAGKLRLSTFFDTGGITNQTSYWWEQGFKGWVDDVRIYNRALSTNEAPQLYAIESGPHVDLIRAVKPWFSNLSLGTNYQLQLSGDLAAWTNQGPPFTATSPIMIYPQYWDVDNWSQLFFRLQVSP